MRYLLAIFLVTSFPVIAANEPIMTYWPMADYMDFLNDAPGTMRANAGSRQGVLFPMLMVFSADGRLTWAGNPAAESPDLSFATALEPAVELTGILSRMDRGWDESTAMTSLKYQHGSPPSAQFDLNQPTAILIVFTLERGVCPPCDQAKEEFIHSLPATWNRVIAPVSTP